MNVNCPFTVSLPVQFTHRSFPIQSPAAVCLLFTPLISSGFKKATFKKKKIQPSKTSPSSTEGLAALRTELVLLEGRQQEAKE